MSDLERAKLILNPFGHKIDKLSKREAEARAIIEHAVTKGIHPVMAVQMQWLDRARKWLKEGE